MIVTFSHPKGGVGKSTLCLNYLSYLRNNNRDFMVVDLDGQHSISNVNKLRQLNQLPEFDIKTFTNIDSMIQFLQDNDGDIVVDSGGFDSKHNRIVLAMSDVIITPLSDSPFEIMRLVGFDNILSEIEKSSNNAIKIKVNLVLNRINVNVKNFDNIVAHFSDSPHYSFMKSIVRDRSIIKFSPANGKSVFELKCKTASDTQACLEMQEFCNEIEILKKG